MKRKYQPPQLTKAQELINTWGAKRHENLPYGTQFRLETETREEGYCETCWSSYQAVILYATEPGGYEKEIEEMGSVELHVLLNDILTAGIDNAE